MRTSGLWRGCSVGSIRTSPTRRKSCASLRGKNLCEQLVQTKSTARRAPMAALFDDSALSLGHTRTLINWRDVNAALASVEPGTAADDLVDMLADRAVIEYSGPEAVPSLLKALQLASRES